MYPLSRRHGLTLLEVILSLFLTAVVAVLIGGLVQLYLVNETRGRESLRQTQTARAILNMIADDIRTTVRYQPYDTSGLQQMLSGAGASMMGGVGGMGGTAGGGTAGGGAAGGGTAGGGAAGGGAAGGGAAGAGMAGGGAAGGGAAGGGVDGGGMAGGGMAGGGMAGGGMAGGGMAGGGMGATGGASGSSMQGSTGTTVIPPGIFGTESSIEIDVSRMPRPDEYVIQPGDVTRGTLGDMPSDIKTVGYYVQSLRADGVLDPLAQLTAQSAQGATSSNGAAGNGMSGGLVRRSLDRAVTQYAYLNGNSEQLSRTGEIIAPEILGIEFSYFNASSGWQTQWDSSQMGLPHVVKVTLAMQSESKARSSPLEPGLMLSTITSGMVEEHGIQFYSVNVIIPGSMLLSAPAPQSGTGTSSNGMSSLGL
jgi:hypothetical protein